MSCTSRNGAQLVNLAGSWFDTLLKSYLINKWKELDRSIYDYPLAIVPGHFQLETRARSQKAEKFNSR